MNLRFVIRIGALAAAALVAVLGSTVETIAQGPPAAPPVRAILRIRGDVYRFQDTRHHTVFMVTPQGVILGDPISADAATWLKAEIAKRFNAPVRYVIHSHSHWDHASGARVFADTAELWGHANMAAEIKKAPEPERMKDVSTPQKTYTDRHTITLGGKSVELIHPGPNHAMDMTVLYFPAERIVHAVDYLTVRRVPRFLDGAPLQAWIDAMKKVEALNFDIFVPGHGNVGNKADVVEQREYFEALVSGVRAGIKSGRTVQELQASNMLERFSWWEDYYPGGRDANIATAYKLLGGGAATR
jgi:glyoxylase-like metal-dependent hydrolase (beta-lactamase superfamily II)